MRVFNEIVRFNKERNLLKSFDMKLALRLLEEELQEVKDHTSVENLVKELCDLVVVAGGEIAKNGYDPQKAMEEVMKQIMSRTGEINELGKWCKNKDQDPKTLYAPNFERCKIKNRVKRR